MNQKIYVLFILILFSYGSNSKANEQFIQKLKTQENKIKSTLTRNSRLAKNTNNSYKENIVEIRQQLESINNDLDNAIYSLHNIELDYNLDLIDFQIYEYTEGYYQVFGRIKNKQKKYLKWVEIRFKLYKNGSFISTDFTYNDFDSYRSSGISPYKYSFINTFLDKVEFDSVAFEVDYGVEYGESDILWDQILTLESVSITPYGDYFKWQGEVKNNFNYSMQYPLIYACIMDKGKMVALDYTFLDVSNNTMQPNSSGVFDSFINLPGSYDEIKYYIGYSLNSLEGNGNLPPNIPIFLKNNYTGYTRAKNIFEAFVIDPDKDRISLQMLINNNTVTDWTGNYISGFNAEFDYTFSQPINYVLNAKASDSNLETAWSDSTTVSITSSTKPQIITSEIDTAIYKNSYFFQFQYSGGIEPVTWHLKENDLPEGLSLDSDHGLITGRPIQSGVFDITVYCTDSGTPSVSDSANFQLEISNQKPNITSSDSVNTFIDTEFTYHASAIDADNNPLYYEFIDYPHWLSVINDSSITGITPHTKIDTSFILIASDGELYDSLKVYISIASKQLSILSNSIKNGLYKNSYNDTLIASGGLSPYSWSIISGQLVNGLTLDDSGVISGVPDSSGNYELSIKVQDSDNPSQKDTLTTHLLINNSNPKITSEDTIKIRKKENLQYYATAIDSENNDLFYSFSKYPSWLSVTDSSINGKVPTTATDTTFSLKVTDGELSDSMIVYIIISEPSFIDELDKPTRFLLSNNYPNPFNPSTNIQLNIPIHTEIKLQIYDISGRKIETLYDGYLDTGSHDFSWYAANLPSGIYFIQCKSIKYNKVIKCTLLK
ncbi:MAG: putative Ig domain-containing protein [candidate division KSB1 bacterium]|nr:putative Ig domain-containing protein [candidate division KSB1 bacterium]